MSCSKKEFTEIGEHCSNVRCWHEKCKSHTRFKAEKRGLVKLLEHIIAFVLIVILAALTPILALFYILTIPKEGRQ